MKQILSILLVCLLLAGVTAGCGARDIPGDADAEPLEIVTTIFPLYDWVRQLLGGHAGEAELTMLLDSGVDLHSYQPTAGDILKLSTCDVFVYVGGESDAWVADALAEAVNPDMIVVDLLDALGDAVKEEELVEGMEPEDDGESEDEDEGPEYDEHVWLSLQNAAALCMTLAEALGRADPANAADYQAAADAYAGQLSALDSAFRQTAETAAYHTVLFGDRFPFRYLCDDYGLDYYAAFAGCSAETEASFETIVFLAGKLDELELPAVLTIEGPDHRIAETIVKTTRTQDQAILSLDSMQSVTAADVEAGADYLSLMEQNLTTLAQAIGAK